MRKNQENSDNTLRIIGEPTLSESIEYLQKGIDSINHGIFDEGSTPKLIDFTISGIKNGIVDHTTIAKLHAELLLTREKAKGAERQKKAELATSIFFIFLAAAKIAKNENKEAASWKAISKAEYYLGRIEELTDPALKLRSEIATHARDRRTQYENSLKTRSEEIIKRLQASNSKSTPYEIAAHAARTLITERDAGELSFTKDSDDLIQEIMNKIIEN